ncbi:hypothetical protein DVK85_08080 [Flavobacterium arcticum]|uniref:Cell shape-determining protein n=1 Tax=Flavobacterium arcticum TaxID=1784713 RepID=A0A345HC88_9FLAO|nr:hypothetical protein [Flavobacterium arcticum]AXG74198.1 hypothetical protein DVK85_08080 [Flavobacterium arcticum]KAF2508215.1 hypothetical protein E0W72_11220 [Flavobacterium arcticum]
MKKSLSIIILTALAFLIFYFGHPVINYGFIGVPFALLLLIITGIFLTTRVETKNNKANFRFTRIHRLLWSVVLLLIAYVTLAPLITSSAMFHNQAYRELIGEVKDGKEISNHIAPLAINKVRVVDERLAYLLGEKILGSDPALGSKATLGHFTIQKVGDELYWVAPLLHTGFFKWLNNSEGTDGYVLVSATNERDVQLVQSINGKPLKIKYQSEAFFMSQMERYLYFNGYATTGLEDYTFEIDDDGNPYWVVTKYKKEIGFGGNNAVGVVVLDAQTGAIQEYSVSETPDWVDRIQPQNFIEDQLNDWGEYVHGYWNFANENKLQITEGLTLVYGENGRPYWYTGLTSVGKDESAVGFVLVDTRTKETTYYHQGGATEYAARRSAEGKVQEKGYNASMPVPYTINNIPTYVMTLKDGGGLVKMYAMVAITDYTIVGVGNTMNEAMMAFKNVYNMTGNSIDPNAISDKNTLTTVVQRIQSDIKSGNSFYYFTVDGSAKIFIGSSQLSNELPITQVGDSIDISFDTDAEQVINVSTFDNLNLGSKK